MYNSKNKVYDIDKIPSYWVFNHYLDLEEELKGQRVNITSLWNKNERTPSMYIFVHKDKNEYYFKDFSSGKYGNKVGFVQELFGISYNEAVHKIISDFNNSEDEVIPIDVSPAENNWIIKSITTRDWNDSDISYWQSFNISKELLISHCVKPLDYYFLQRNNGYLKEDIRIKKPNMYGYYDKNDNLCKVYSPFDEDFKFYIIEPIVHGLDQLTYSKSNLVICSSLKDLMSLSSFGLNLEAIAANSETTMIEPYLINYLKKKYDKVITLLDCDNAGIKAMKRYKELYNLDSVLFEMEKDISDSIKVHGPKKVYNQLYPILRANLHKL